MRRPLAFFLVFVMILTSISGVRGAPPSPPDEAAAGAAFDSSFANRQSRQALGLLGEAGALVLERGTAIDPEWPTGLPGDRLLLETEGDKEPTVLFTAPGRAIEDAIVGNLDALGDPEIVLLLDSGGSGGFRDIVVLACREKGYRPIYEAGGFRAARVVLVDRSESGGPDVVISHVRGFGAGPAFPRWQTTVLSMEDDRMVERRVTAPVAPLD
jgi:hypothetical protein